jgi:predicted PurR-regulated permease PerM
MKIFILTLCILTGYICSLTSNAVTEIQQYSDQQNTRFDKLLNILQDWKEKDTRR